MNFSYWQIFCRKGVVMTTTNQVPGFIQTLKSLSSVRINNGPGKFDLMTGLFDQQKSVFFEVEARGNTTQRIEFLVDAVGKEDGSGESWLLRIRPILAGYTSGSTPIKAYYSSKTRKGTMSIVTDHRHLY
jgi:hypothetical protein